MHLVRGIDEDRLARFHVAQNLEPQRIERDRFGSNQVFGALRRLVGSDDHRADAVWIAEGKQPVTRDQHDHRVRALAAPMHAGHRGKDRIEIETEALGCRLHFVRQHVEQHLGIRTGVDVPPVETEHLFLQLLGVGQVAVVRKHQAKRRIDVERLRLGRIRR